MKCEFSAPNPQLVARLLKFDVLSLKSIVFTAEGVMFVEEFFVLSQ